MFVQAIKENFELPVVLDDEDENVVHDFNEVFMQVAEENPQLAIDIWTWVIKEFGPFKKYMSNDWTVYNFILTSTDDYPDEFLPLAIKRLGEDIKFCDELITKNPQYPHGMSAFITKALELDFCSVIFNASNQPYTYLIGEFDIKIGDKVVVPVGNDNTERIATVVSTSQHMRLTAPFPVDKAKKVIRKVEE